jgi:hypothetical protein
MRKRLLLLLMSVALVLLGGWLTLWPSSPQHRINRESFARIQEGMTEQEVESILGVPAGDYATARVAIAEDYDLRVPAGAVQKQWTCDEGTILVFFYPADKVCVSRFIQVARVDESFLDKARRWLRL